jgi:predicted transposase/invertase (TIGR01784 family)
MPPLRCKLAILLPFYVLKLRKQAVSARTPKRRAELAAEMKSMLGGLMAAVDSAEQTGLMSKTDKRIVLEHMERLYRELFAQYDEFKEGDVMLQDVLLTYSEEAELKGIEKGKAEGKFEVARKMLARGMALPDVAEIAELPIDKIQSLVPHP